MFRLPVYRNREAALESGAALFAATFPARLEEAMLIERIIAERSTVFVQSLKAEVGLCMEVLLVVRKTDENVKAPACDASRNRSKPQQLHAFAGVIALSFRAISV
jgi:hypothetical protein